MNESQENLFVIPALWNVGNHDRSLLDICTKFDKEMLELPRFQREFIWDITKIHRWIETIISRQGIGVIVTYQILADPRNKIYLADGYQRVEATRRFIKNPTNYKFQFSSEQAAIYADGFNVTIQHRLYKDHSEARSAFQNINLGTSLTPEEFHKGELILSENGEYLLNKIQGIFDKTERRICKTENKRVMRGRYKRDALAAYFQWSTKTDNKSFWGASTSSISGDKGEPIERKVARHIEHMSIEDLEKEMRKFEAYLDSHFSYIEFCQNKVYGELGNGIMPTISRWLLHFHIYCDNLEISAKDYSRAAMGILLAKKESSSGTHGGDVIIKLNGKDQIFSMRMDNVRHLELLGIAFDAPGLMDIREKRSRKLVTTPGFHESHKIPFASAGNGETFAEPTILNLIRGKNPV